MVGPTTFRRERVLGIVRFKKPYRSWYMHRSNKAALVDTDVYISKTFCHGGVTSIIKVYTDVRLEWGILFRPPSI